MLEREFDPTLTPIEVVPQDVSRVYLNLFGNGFYAASEKGSDRPVLRVMTRDLGEAVEIRVRDSGTGIAPEIRDKLFRPFVTTKPTAKVRGSTSRRPKPTRVCAQWRPFHGHETDDSKATHTNGGTIGFQMKDAAHAEAWHKAGVANVGTSIEDPPGMRTNGAYLAYLVIPTATNSSGLFGRLPDLELRRTAFRRAVLAQTAKPPSYPRSPKPSPAPPHGFVRPCAVSVIAESQP